MAPRTRGAEGPLAMAVTTPPDTRRQRYIIRRPGRIEAVTEAATWDSVSSLAGRVRRDPDASPQRGATADDLRDLERRLKSPLPPSLVRWLLILNGDTIGEGGVFGARSDAP